MNGGIIVGLTGPACSGKGEIALAIERTCLCRYVEFYFAEKLWKMISALTGRPVEWLRDRRNKDTAMEIAPGVVATPRRMAQTLGTEWGRRLIHDDLWCSETLARVDSFVAVMRTTLPDDEFVIAITDVRFDNEAIGIRDRGGVIWEASRPGADTCESHPSESGISPHLIDRRIVNGGSLADLHTAAAAALIATMKDIAKGRYRDRREPDRTG